ncbi:uncharacterized protein LOC121382732 [Gigantopelta aegis]|uniref:uncharacterized protein LOC121382732 n=1 Tax=Gigantopelta aegis TaxID=1735272 RepID=UPI001B88CED3|nr:uncharacterized protein LOC121382732 [Gigantopelta aegis]XP_041368224.1 uncharacterized protein LOC121382732 [Gigantopelta aegis]
MMMQNGSSSEMHFIKKTHNNFQRNTENTGQDGSKHNERHRLAKISRQESGDSQPSSIVLPSRKQTTHTQNTPKSLTFQTLAMTRHGAELKSKPPHVNKKRHFALSSISSEDETDLISFTDDGHADNETSTVPAKTG